MLFSTLSSWRSERGMIINKEMDTEQCFFLGNGIRVGYLRQALFKIKVVIFILNFFFALIKWNILILNLKKCVCFERYFHMIFFFPIFQGGGHCNLRQCPGSLRDTRYSCHFVSNWRILVWDFFSTVSLFLSLYSYTIWRIEKYWFVTDLFENWF